MSLILSIHPKLKLRFALSLAALLLALNAVALEHSYDVKSDHHEHQCSLFSKGTHSLTTDSPCLIPSRLTEPPRITQSNGIVDVKPQVIFARAPPRNGYAAKFTYCYNI